MSVLAYCLETGTEEPSFLCGEEEDCFFPHNFNTVCLLKASIYIILT